MAGTIKYTTSDKSIYSPAQWCWAGERYKEGYSQVELQEFMGIGSHAIQDHFEIYGYKEHRGHRRAKNNDLIPLDDRKMEFNLLWQDKELK